MWNLMACVSHGDRYDAGKNRIRDRVMQMGGVVCLLTKRDLLCLKETYYIYCNIIVFLRVIAVAGDISCENEFLGKAGGQRAKYTCVSIRF